MCHCVSYWSVLCTEQVQRRVWYVCLLSTCVRAGGQLTYALNVQAYNKHTYLCTAPLTTLVQYTSLPNQKRTTHTTYLKQCYTFRLVFHKNKFSGYIIPNYSQQDATFLDLFTFTDALHVSGGSSAHHQEHITVHTASGITNQYCC